MKRQIAQRNCYQMVLVVSLLLFLPYYHHNMMVLYKYESGVFSYYHILVPAEG